MRATWKLTLGTGLLLLNIGLSRLGTVPLGAVDVMALAALAAWRIGLVRFVLVGSGLLMLVAMSIPRGCGPRSKSYLAAMKSDLKNLASQQEVYYADRYSYSASFEELQFVSSSGVTVTLVASERGWAATASHAALGDSDGCAIYYGEAPAPTVAGVSPVEPGAIACAGS